MSIGAYVAVVDRLLAAAQPLFGNPATGRPVPLGEPPSALVCPDESSAVGAAVAGAAATFEADRSRAETVLAAAEAVAAAARARMGQAGVAAADIRRAAAAQAAAIDARPASPEAVVLLVRTMDDRLAQMEEHLAATRAAVAEGATELRACAGTLAAMRR